MPDEEKDAIESESSPDKKGAKEEGVATPEALKAAQEAAEKFRKEKDELQDKLDEKEAELDKLNEKSRLTDAEKKRKALLEAGIGDDEALIAELDAEAKKGTRWAQAVKAEIRKTAREIANEEVKNILSKRDLDRDFEDRDEWLEEIAEKREMTVKDLKAKIGKFADETLKASPKKQAKTAYVKFLEHEKVEKEKADWEAQKRKDQNFRDGGTSHDGDQGKSGKVDFTKDWRAAKTSREKELALHDI